MRLRRYLLVILIAAIAAGFTIYLNFDRIAIFAASKLYSIDISYKHMNKDPKAGLVFEDLRVMHRKLGLGFFSLRATVKPSLGKDWLKNVLVDFKFKDVHFLKNKADEKKAAYDTISQLVAMPFEGRWMYKEVSGLVEIFSNGITIKRFSANGKEMRLSVSGDFYYNNVIDSDITVYFSRDVLKEVPPELHSVIMQDEPDEWKSFSVKVKGDLSSPAIQITGKLFRLNFGTVTMRD
jgi:hypothetical protein